MHSGDGARFRVALLACLLGVIFDPATFAAPPAWDSARRADVIPGQPVILPVRAPADPGARDLQDLQLEYVGHGRVRAELIELRFQTRPSDAWDGWMGTRREWRAFTHDQSEKPELTPGEGSVWVVRAEPPDTDIGQGLAVRLHAAGRSGPELRPRWIDPAPDGADPADPAVRARALVPASSRAATLTPELARTLEELRADPLTAWRAELIETGLDPYRGRPQEQHADDPGLTTPLLRDGRLDPVRVLDEVRAHESALWRAGLLRLWSIDPRLAERVRLALAAIISPRTGVWVPVWPGERISDELRRDLIEPGLSDAELVELVTAWLVERPSAIAWVLDDAAQITPTAGGVRLFSRIAIGDLTGNGTLVWVDDDTPGTEAGDELSAREIYTVAARRSSVLSLEAPVPDSLGRSEEVWAPLPMRFSQGQIELSVQGRPVVVRPPGFPIVGFRNDLSLGAFPGRGEVGRLGAVARGTGSPVAGSIERVAIEPGSRSSRARHGWVLELRLTGFGADAGSAPGTVAPEVTVWFGPRGRSIAQLRVGNDGEADWRVSSGSAEPLTRVVRGDDGAVTRVIIEINQTLRNRDDMLRLGVQAIDADGERWSWPRASVPWEPEPSRLGIDLDQWFTPERP